MQSLSLQDAQSFGLNIKTPVLKLTCILTSICLGPTLSTISSARVVLRNLFRYAEEFCTVMVLPSVIITTAEQSTQIRGIIEYNIVNEYTASSFWGDSRKEITPLF